MSGASFSVRWQGFLSVSTATSYTFIASMSGTDERFRMWLDTQLVLDAWDSLSAITYYKSHLSTSELIDLKIEYKEVQGTHGFRLQWFKTNSSPSHIPAARMCSGQPILGSPTNLLVAPALPGDRSEALGQGLTLASVGRLASFTIYARDRYGNNVSFSEANDSILFYSNGTTHAAALSCTFQNNSSNDSRASKNTSTKDVGCQPSSGAFNGDEFLFNSGTWYATAEGNGFTSQYVISYKATRSGSYSHLVQAFRRGGLQGNYYAGRKFEGPSLLTRRDRIIAFAWARDDVSSREREVTLSVRWTGLLQAALNETYTLILRSSGGGGELGDARVFLQGRLLMQTAEEDGEREARCEIEGNTLQALDLLIEHRQ